MEIQELSYFIFHIYQVTLPLILVTTPPHARGRVSVYHRTLRRGQECTCRAKPNSHVSAGTNMPGPLNTQS